MDPASPFQRIVKAIEFGPHGVGEHFPLLGRGTELAQTMQPPLLAVREVATIRVEPQFKAACARKRIFTIY